MSRLGGILLCFALVALVGGCGEKAEVNKAGGEAKKNAEADKKPEPTTAKTYHVEWRRCAAYFNARDERKLAECFPTGSELVIAGREPIAGPDGVVAHFKELWTAFPNYSIDTQASWVSGKTAAILVLVGGTQKREFRGKKSAEKTTRQLALYLLRLSDEWKIEKATLYIDQALVGGQLGWIEGSFQPPAPDPFAFRDHLAAAGDDAELVAAAHLSKYEVAFNDRNLDAVMELFAEEATLYHPALPGPVEGKSAIRAVHEQFFQRVPDAAQDTTNRIAVGGWVISQHTWTGTMSGLALSNPAASLCRVDNELITGMWSFENTLVGREKLAEKAASNNK